MRRGTEITIGYLNRKERKRLAKRSSLPRSCVALVGPFIISIFEASLSKGASRSPPQQQSFIEISAVAAALLLLSTKEKGRSGRSNGRGRTLLGRELIKYYIVVDVQSCLGDLQETGGFL